MNMQNQVKRAVCLIMALGMLPSVRAAQSRAQSSRTVTLVERATLPQQHRAMVFRRASGPASRDFIALTPNATASDLSAAIVLLEGLYARHGDRPDRDITAAVADVQVMIETDTPHAKLHASFVQQLRGARASHVDGFGEVKTVQINVSIRRARVEPLRAP